MEKNSKVICYGSLVTLKNLENFYLCAQGFIDNSPYLVKQIRHNFSCAIFRIVPCSIYSIQNDLLDYTRKVKEEDFFEKIEKLDKLEDNLEGEIKTNLQTYNSLKGKPVRYDSLIQLEHLQSHKFLTLEADENAEIEKENLKASLEDFPSGNSHFRILPGFNYQKFSDGIVKSLDKVHLEIMLSDERKPAYLHSSRCPSNEVMTNGIYSILIQDAKMEKDYLEVNISLDQKTKWVITEFAPVSDQDGYLMCGDYIWMTKPEENTSLSVGKKKQSKGRSLIFTQNSNDTNGLWMVENEDPSIGGQVEIGVAYRLRHISSGLYLAVNPELQPCLSKDCTEGTLWNMIPLEPDNKYIRVDEMCLIINSSTQRTISVTEVHFQVSTVPCVQTGSTIDEDSVFKITRGGGEIVWETFFLLHCYPILRGYSSCIGHGFVGDSSQRYMELHEFKKQSALIETCIVKLIQFCNNKLQGMIGIDNHYGEVQLIRQRMLKEQNFFEVLANILDKALPEPINYEQVIEATKNKEKNKKKLDSDNELAHLKHLSKIIKKIYELLTTLCRKNNDNQIYAYKFFPIFMKHIGLGLGAKDFILSVLGDNEQLMLSINNPQSIDKGVDMIDYFFKLLKKDSKSMKITLIDFFKSICVFKGQGVTANQEKVLKIMLMNEEIMNETLPKTIINENKLWISIDGKEYPVESLFSSGICHCAHDDILYFTKLLELYANMCVGRNFEVSAQLMKYFPFEVIHSMMWNSELSDDLRAAFCKMLLNLYVDCSPREEVIKPQLIKEFTNSDCKKEDTMQRVDTMSNENSKKSDSLNIYDKFGQAITFWNNKNDSLDEFPIMQKEFLMFELLNNIFESFNSKVCYSTFTCELLRLTSKLMKFELLGVSCTDFARKKLVQNPKYPEHELDIVKILRSIVPLLVTEARKTTTHTMIKRRRSTKLENNQNKENNQNQYIYLSSLLQDTGNIKDPLIRSAANLKNFISSLKQNPFNGIESKSCENRIKLKICKMLHYYLDCRQDFLLTNIVAWFNDPETQLVFKSYEKGSKDSRQYLLVQDGQKEPWKEESLNLLPPIMKFVEDGKLQEFIGNEGTVFTCFKGPYIPDLNHLNEAPLLKLLIQAFTYTENYKVQSSLFRLIIRCYEQRKELLRNISNLHPISNNADIELFIWLKRNIKEFMKFSEQSELWLKYWEHEPELKSTYYAHFKNIIEILKQLESVLFESSYIENGVMHRGNRDEVISPSRQKMMNYLDADNLVLALIKDGIHELIALKPRADYRADPEELNEEENDEYINNLTKLFDLCFSFLTNFVKNNPQNQKRLYKSLHIFLQHLNIPLGQMELICEIFRDNRSLIEKIDEKFLGIFKTSIFRYGRRAMFLEILKTIQTVNDKPVPSIQRIILNMFIPEELDLFLLYMENPGSPEFSFDVAETENPDYVDEPYDYHAVLLEVLAKCGFGVTGMYFNEAKCQNIVTLNNIFKILINAEQDDSNFKDLKIPMLDFFFNIYLDCEMINMELKTCEKFLDYIKIQAQVLEELVDPDEDYMKALEIFINILLKYRTSYIKKGDSLYYDSNDMKAIKHFLTTLRDNYSKIHTSILDSKFHEVLKELSESVDIHILSGNDEPEILHTDHENIPRSAQRSMRDDTSISSNWKDFMEYLVYNSKLKEKVDEEEYALLVAIHFSHELSSESNSELNFEKVIKSIVNFIRLSRSQQPPLSLTISAIELLARILANPIHDKYTKPQDAKKTLQNSMIGYGVVRVLFALMCDSNIEAQIFKSLMTVCIELLDGGNEIVQNEIYLYFNNTPNSETFFERIHQMFLDNIDRFAHGQVANMKRLKVFKHKQDDIKSLLRFLQLLCEGHNLELQNYMRYQSRSRISFDMISDIIALLEILIEKKQLRSFKVVSQCFDTLTEFIQGPCTKNQEAIIDGKFLELVSTLLSMGLEGDNYGDRKIENYDVTSEGGNIYEDEKSTLEDWMIAHLKYKAMITVLSLMEGRTDNYIVTRLIRSFNLEILKENLKSIFIDYVRMYGADFYDFEIFDHIKGNEDYVYGSDENKQDKEPKYYSLVIENGFMIYHLLKTFMENDDPESQEIIAGELDQLQKFREDEDMKFFSKHVRSKKSEYSALAIKDAVDNYKYTTNNADHERHKEFLLNATFRFFDMYTGKIEVVFNGNIFRVYFSLPPQFRGLTKEIRDNFHASVNRDTDQTKLKFLLRKAASIIEQITHEHFLLNAMQNNQLIHLIASKVYIWRDIAFGLTIVLNILVLLSYSNYNDHDRMNSPSLFNYTYDNDYWSTETTKSVIRTLGIIQLVCCLIIVAFFLLKVGPIVARRGWKKHEPSIEFLKSNPNKFKLTVLKLKQIVSTIFYILIDFHVLYHIAYTVFSVLGISTHPFYFSLLLLDILYKYRSLQNVVKSFIVPRKALILTFCMMIIFMYIFAIIGFFYFQEDFDSKCKTLFWCTIILWDASFKTDGAIGGYMYKYEDGDLHTARFFYDNFFNILLEVIIIGVVEGLIIDTFAALREEQERSNNDRETKCFICGLDRDFIERKTNMPFSRHTQVDHNEWNYVLFLAYLERKHETEYTGLESYVKDQIDREEVSWIPNHRAMGIKGVSQNEEAENIVKINVIAERLKKLETQLIDLKLKQKHA